MYNTGTSTILLIVYYFAETSKSESLKDLFYVILVIGNMINAVSRPMCLMLCCYSYHVQGSRSGGAYGFTVTSLDNLRDTRANKPRMTFMHYIVSVSSTIMCVQLNYFWLVDM